MAGGDMIECGIGRSWTMAPLLLGALLLLDSTLPRRRSGFAVHATRAVASVSLLVAHDAAT